MLQYLAIINILNRYRWIILTLKIIVCKIPFYCAIADRTESTRICRAHLYWPNAKIRRQSTAWPWMLLQVFKLSLA